MHTTNRILCLYVFISCILNVGCDLSSKKPEVSTYFYICTKNDKVGLIDEFGRIQIKPGLSFVRICRGSKSAIIQNEGVWSLVTYEDGIVRTTKLEFPVDAIHIEGVADLGDGLYTYRMHGEKNFYNMIDIKKQFKMNNASDPVYFVMRYHNDRLPFVKNELFGIADRLGNIVLKPKYALMYEFDASDRAVVKIDGYFGYIDRAGAIAIPANFTIATNFCENVAAVFDGKKWWYIKPDGTPAFGDTVFSHATPFAKDQLALVSVLEGGSMGYINTSGVYQIAPKFLWGDVFSEGLACVGLKDYPNGTSRIAYIDTQGRIAFQLDNVTKAYRFIGDLALIQLTDEIGYVNKFGKWIWKDKITESTSKHFDFYFLHCEFD